MNHEVHMEAAALEALGALAPAESAALEAHARECMACLRERATLREVAAMLALSVAPVAPPERLRAELLQSVRRLRANGRAFEDEVTSVLSPAPESFAQHEKFMRREKFVLARTVAYGALAASLLLSVALFSVWRESRALRVEVKRAGAEARAAREEVARANAELARERELAELLASPDARLTALAGTKDAPPRARASLAFDRSSGRAVLVASGLPSAPEGKAYQLWYITDKPVPGPIFNADAGGRGTLRDDIPPEGRDAKQFAVTLEPAGGARAPTGSILLVGTLLNTQPSGDSTR